MIREVTITGYKALECVSVTLEPLTVIVGANASGKSSFLDALALLANASRDQRQMKALVDAAGEGTVRTHGTEQLLEMVALTDDGELRLRVNENRGWANTFKPRDGALQDLTTWKTPPSTDEVAGVPPAMRLRLDLSVLMKPALLRLGYSEILPNGEGLAAVLQSMQLAEDGRFKQVSDSLARVVPGIVGLRTTQENLRFNNQPDVHAVVEARTRAGGWCRATDLSEGTLVTLAILTSVHSKRSTSLLLVDDIDRGLHPRAQSKLIDCVRGVTKEDPTLQIICTTHSPHLVNCFEPREVRMFSLNEVGHTVVLRLEDHPEWPQWKDTFASGEFWAAVGDEWVVEATG